MNPENTKVRLAASAVMICAGEAPLLERSLEALAGFEEVLIYFNGPGLDAIKERLKPWSNVTLHDGAFMGFGPTKQKAIQLARHDWVFSIDTDEWPDSELLEAMARVDWSSATVAYEVERKNRFLGQHVRRGGWGNDRLLRFFNRRSAGFNDKPVHEKVEPGQGVRVELLNGTLWHEAVTDVDQFLQKISRYSTLNAENTRRASHPFVALLRAQFAFFRSYILQLGVLAGWRGLVIAYARGVGTFFKYTKRYVRRVQGR